MRLSILIDSPESWFIPYGEDLMSRLKAVGHNVTLVHSARDLPPGDCAFLLSCSRIVNAEVRSRNKHNVVVHASKLPEGRGFAPLMWQILEGRNEIWLTAFEAVEQVDAGDVYWQEAVRFDGHELHDELRDVVGRKVVELAERFVTNYPLPASPQSGTATWYRRRAAADSELDPSKPLRDLFNQLRTASNANYPAFFRIHIGDKEHTYTLKIEEKSLT